jgi:hypothetical protein
MGMFGAGLRWQERYQADRALRTAWHGEIASVNFDFRHPELPPDLWDCPSVLDGRRWNHPGWYFATDPSSSEPSLLGEALGAFATDGVRQAEAAGKLILYPRDLVIASAVELVSAATDRLRPDVDQEVARLHFVIRNPEGEQRAGGSCRVYRKGAMPPDRLDLGVLPAFSERLSRLPDEEPATADAHTLRVRVDKGMEAVEAEMRRRRRDDDGSGAWMSVAVPEVELRRLVNTAALYGYRLGHAEAAHHMEAMAKTGSDRTNQSVEAGRLGAEQNRDLKRADFAEAHWSLNPRDTIHAVIEAWRVTRPHDSESSLRRSFELYYPPSSPSYEKAQANIAKRRAQAAKRRARNKKAPTAGR